MPPTQWRTLHNKVHHSNTNNENDPDRNYLHQQPRTWASWIHKVIVPSLEVNPIGLIIGMGTAWGFHDFRNLTSVLLFPNADADYVPAAFAVSAGDRRKIVGELGLITLLHLGLIATLGFKFWNLALGYFLPIALGHAIGMFYIYTNHLVCPMTSVNDPLINSVSLKVPAIFNCLHLNFSYHTEHHIFPGLNSDYYPQAQALLLEHYPDRFNLI